MRGKGSNLAYFSKFFDDLFNLYEPHKINFLGAANLLSYRLFSSNGRQFSNSGRSDYNGRRNNYDINNNDGGYSKFGSDKYGGSNRDKFDAQQDYDGSRVGSNPGRPMRGERQRADFGGRNVSEDGDFQRQERMNDGYGKPLGRDESRGGGTRFGDDLMNPGEGSGGLGGDGEGRGSYQPSVHELLNAPCEVEGSGKKVGEDFLAKFRLGSEEKEEKEGSGEPFPEDEKMEAPEGADEIFKKMKQSSLIPNAVAMLDGLCKDGLVQEAMKLFGAMREKRSMPEVVVYTAVVEGFCKAQRLGDAKRIFRKMQSNGIVPNAFSYTVLIKGLCKGKMLDDALDFCLEMVEGGHSPNVQTFTGLVHEFCNEKGVEEARKAIVILKQKGFLLDEKAVRVYYDKNGPTTPMVWEAIFGPKKTAQKTAWNLPS